MMTQGKSAHLPWRGLVMPALVWAWMGLTAGPLDGQQGERRGWLGVQVEFAAGSGEMGLPIRSVLPGGPGARARLTAGDVIVRIDGVPATRESLEASLARIRPGDRLDLVVRRGQTNREVAVMAAPRPHLSQQQGARERMRWGERPAAMVGLRAVAGAEFRGMDPALARYFGVDRGLLVLEVADGTPARAAGLEPGDVVKTVRGTSVATVSDLRRIVAQTGAAGRQGTAASQGTDAIILDIIRDGEPRTLELRIRRAEPR
ncbi:MAG: PDZ domain-containing protein [Gemmatimonadales bacterium]|nr:MAG: PDZ domain-containing protein [Gemmatimonadales bacterium]